MEERVFARWSESGRSPQREKRATGHCNSSEGPEREISDGAVRMKGEVSDAWIFLQIKYYGNLTQEERK